MTSAHLADWARGQQAALEAGLPLGARGIEIDGRAVLHALGLGDRERGS